MPGLGTSLLRATDSTPRYLRSHSLLGPLRTGITESKETFSIPARLEYVVGLEHFAAPGSGLQALQGREATFRLSSRAAYAAVYWQLASDAQQRRLSTVQTMG